MTPDEWQARQRAVTAATLGQVLALWSRVDRDAIGPSWDLLRPAAVAVVTRGQTSAAAGAADYVNDAIGAQTGTSARPATVNPPAFAGVASDGRPLETLLDLPATTAGLAASRGLDPATAVRTGRFNLAGLVSTQVYDAGRLAVGAAITSHPEATGYRRQLRGATNCARCVVLAGAWYRWNRGFQRHPRCDCVHVPSIGPKSDYAGAEGFDPAAYFESLDPAAQDRVFTKAGAQAIRDGADLGQVVNARRGMRTTTMYGRKVTTTTVNARRGVPRLMPEQIYADARDRDEAVRLLRRFGFI